MDFIKKNKKVLIAGIVVVALVSIVISVSMERFEQTSPAHLPENAVVIAPEQVSDRAENVHAIVTPDQVKPTAVVTHVITLPEAIKPMASPTHVLIVTPQAIGKTNLPNHAVLAKPEDAVPASHILVVVKQSDVKPGNTPIHLIVAPSDVKPGNVPSHVILPTRSEIPAQAVVVAPSEVKPETPVVHVIVPPQQLRPTAVVKTVVVKPSDLKDNVVPSHVIVVNSSSLANAKTCSDYEYSKCKTTNSCHTCCSNARRCTKSF